MEHFDDLTAPPVVGRTYLARCVFVPGRIGAGRRGLWWPVHGRAHTDEELGVPQKHHHLAIPLLTHQQVAGLAAQVTSISGEQWAYAKITAPAWTCEQYESNFTRESVRRRICYRPWPAWPASHAERVTATLERLYPQPLPASMRCPHRGINLASVPVRDGVITCPGHGLSWCAATGRPVCAVDGRYRDG